MVASAVLLGSLIENVPIRGLRYIWQLNRMLITSGHETFTHCHNIVHFPFCSFQVNAAVKWSHNSNASAEKKLSPINLAKYNMFRKLDFVISGEKYKSFAAYNQGKDLLGFKASGILFQDEVCNWRSRISNKTKTGSFVANCPSGITVKANIHMLAIIKAVMVQGRTILEDWLNMCWVALVPVINVKYRITTMN